jgi:hypothetical protein
MGSAALFTRALLSAQREHAVLKDVRIRADTVPRMDEVGDVVQTGGSSVTAEALEAVLVELIELLRRFIGTDVVVRILCLSDSEQRNAIVDRTSRRTLS